MNQKQHNIIDASFKCISISGIENFINNAIIHNDKLIITDSDIIKVFDWKEMLEHISEYKQEISLDINSQFFNSFLIDTFETSYWINDLTIYDNNIYYVNQTEIHKIKIKDSGKFNKNNHYLLYNSLEDKQNGNYVETISSIDIMKNHNEIMFFITARNGLLFKEQNNQVELVSVDTSDWIYNGKFNNNKSHVYLLTDEKQLKIINIHDFKIKNNPENIVVNFNDKQIEDCFPYKDNYILLVKETNNQENNKIILRDLLNNVSRELFEVNGFMSLATTDDEQYNYIVVTHNLGISIYQTNNQQ
jgi:hypothetical protein